VHIPLDAIKESPRKLREVQEDDRFEELKASIAAQGLLQPVKVRPVEGGYELIYGHRRVAALRALGHETVEALVQEVDEQTALVQSIIENLHRDDLDEMEEAEIFHQLRQREFSNVAIGRMIGKSEGYVRRRLNLLQLPTEVRELVVTKRGTTTPATAGGGISLDSANEIARSATAPEEVVTLARKAIRERLTSGEVRSLASQLREAEDEDERQAIIDEPFSDWEPYQPVPKEVSREAVEKKARRHETKSLGEMVHSKLMWNYNRIDLDRFNHFTIGYAQRGWENLRDLLWLARATLLVDTRIKTLVPAKPDLSGMALRLKAGEAEMRYIHQPELGIEYPEPEERDERPDYEAAWNTYAQRVDAERLRALFGEALVNERIAFMSAELDPMSGHRHRLAMTLEDMGYKVFDL
jgi:ParB family chromosome partitioning protein